MARIFSQEIWIINELQSVGDWKGPRRSEDVGKGECEVSVCVCTYECASLAVCTRMCCACVCTCECASVAVVASEGLPGKAAWQ